MTRPVAIFLCGLASFVIGMLWKDPPLVTLGGTIVIIAIGARLK